LWVGHNWLNYDYPVLNDLLKLEVMDLPERSIDTLLISRLVDYSRPTGHSIESYGLEFSLEKGKFNDFKKYSKEMEDYCVRDVDICLKVYLKYLKYLSNPEHKYSILLEHKFSSKVINSLVNNGFTFNSRKAKVLLKEVEVSLSTLDKEILEAFPPKLKLIREITPKETKYGTLSKVDFRWVTDGDLSIYNGGPFSRCRWEQFNPSSHKQIIDVLHAAGWKPTDRTKTHIEKTRHRRGVEVLDLADQVKYAKYGWKINENNLETLPPTAPAPARSLAKRILHESRRRTLTEWLGLVQEDDRIHGKFNGIGTWTHRMATQKPNMQNIPNALELNGDVKYLGKELRSLWRASRNRLLVGVDAEGIQLRVFAHYIDDQEFTDALVRGTKAEKTDPHSLNARILGPVCGSRQVAKRFIYALLLGAGISKLSEILGCSEVLTQEALDRLLTRYVGWERLRVSEVPRDAKRGYFIGVDGRKVRIPGDTIGQRKHLCMSGYLQNAEAVIMKMATLQWMEDLDAEDLWFRIVNMVHDEWQVETKNHMEEAIRVAETLSGSLRKVGKILGLRCPLEGSFYNEDNRDYTIGTTWYDTH
jgi:DNA polymerase-1